MLSDFIRTNRDNIIMQARARVAQRSAPRPTDRELVRGIPLFVDQLIDALCLRRGREDMAPDATRHGANLLRMGFTIAQVVHDYGDVCQIVTQLAIDQDIPISAEEFKQLNLCLDEAIAAAVTEYSRLREGQSHVNEAERLGYLAHELRNKINAAMLAYGVLKEGQVSLGGSTGAVLDRNLKGLQDLITRSLAEVRVESGVQHRERLLVRDLMEELEVEGSMAANAKKVHFSVGEVDPDVEIDADRALLAGAIMNLVTNAVKFTPANGHVSLRTSVAKGRVMFDVQDECGGLPQSGTDQLFSPWTQRSSDKRGLGLGLPLVRRSVQALGGHVGVKDLPGIGCIFSISLLAAPGPHPSAPTDFSARIG